MDQLTQLFAGIVALSTGSVLGYYARQSIAKRDWKTIESKIQKRIEKALKEADSILSRAKEKSASLLNEAKKEEEATRKRLFRA
jgi:hypothetical protein